MAEKEDKLAGLRPDTTSAEKPTKATKPKTEVKTKAEPRVEADIKAAREETPARAEKEAPPAKSEKEDATARLEKEAVDVRARETGGESNGGDDKPPPKAEKPAPGGDKPAPPPPKQGLDKAPVTKRAEAEVQPTRSELSKEFARKFVVERVEEIQAKPVKNVVIEQDPPAGEFVLAGTTINLAFTFKENLPLDSFKDVDKALADKFSTVGEVMSELSRNDQTAKDAADVLKKEARDYRNLTPTDKSKVDKFIKERTGVDPDANAERVRNIFNDMKFMHDM